jgi:hypothetical protein
MHPETHIPHLKKLSLSPNSNFLSLDNGPQKLTFPTSKNSLAKLQLYFSQQWTPETHIPHLKKLSPSKLPTFFLSPMHPETTHIPQPEKYALSFVLSLSLSLFLSKVPTFFLSIMHPRNSHFPPRKIRSLSLSLSLSLSIRESLRKCSFLPTSDGFSREKASRTAFVGTRRATNGRRFKIEREKSHTTLSVPFTGSSVVVVQWAKEGRSQVSK